MKTRFLLIGGLITLPAFAASSNPIVGTWRVLVPGTTCSETYTFAKDGVRTYTSAKEKAESRYTLSEKPDTSGYFKFTDLVVKTNGEPDCSGQSTPEGDLVIAYVHFSEAGDSFSLCRAPSQETCVAQFTRVPAAP